MKNRLIFLGTGGGGSVTYTQTRKTGGVYFELGDKKFILDPGPGSLVYSHKLGLKPESWDGVLITHIHPDHCTDANVILDAISRDKKPFLVAGEPCLKPGNEYPCVSKYHQSISNAYPVKVGDKVGVDGIKITANLADHYSPTVGFVISYNKIVVGYASDGIYYKGQEKGYGGCDVLILNLLVPPGKKATKKHMGVEDAIKLVSAIKNKPKLVVITHFSFWMLRANVWAQARRIQDETGVKTIPAEDFMELDLETLNAKKLKER